MLSKYRPSGKSNGGRGRVSQSPVAKRGIILKRIGCFPGTARPLRTAKPSRPIRKRYKVVKRKKRHYRTEVVPDSRLKCRKRRTKQIKYRYIRKKLYYKHPSRPPRNPEQEVPVVTPLPVRPNPNDFVTNFLIPNPHPIPQPPEETSVPEQCNHLIGGKAIEVLPEAIQDIIPTAVPASLSQQAAADARIRDSVIGADIVPDPAFSNLLALGAESDHLLSPDINRLEKDESVGTIVSAETIALLAQEVKGSGES